MKKFNLILLFLGSALMAYLVWRVGPGKLATEVRAVGWVAIPLILAEGAANLAHTIGWRYCISRSGSPVRLSRLFRMAMAGFAMNYLLPSASVGGEASKAALLTSSRPAPEAFSSVLLDKLATAIGHLILALIGAGFVLYYARLPSEIWIPMGSATLLLAAGIGAFLLIQRHGKLGALLRWFADRRLGGNFGRWAAARISEVDDVLRKFYRDRPCDFALSIACHLLGHSAAILQAWLFLALLGRPASLAQVACAGLISLWFDLLTFAVPLNIGALEGSRIIALTAIGNNAPLGLAYGLTIRIAQLFWAAFGLVSYGFMALPKGTARALQLKFRAQRKQRNTDMNRLKECGQAPN